MGYFIAALKNYAVFSGRARRKEYWMFFLFYMIFSLILTFVDALMGTFVLTGIYALVMIVPSLSVMVRRLHDTGRSGWWFFIGLVPVIGAIVLLVFLVQNSHDENDYGANPKLAEEPA